ncbi:peptide deformylase [Streptomyces sp. NPDC050803]|uniref:peptide deformylase n=1 Tax=unclassified Streptomyces TaxID=2593676 RepID=UPI00342E3879
MARLVQHEIDHLEGKLYTNRMPGAEPIPVEEYRQTDLIYSCQASVQADRMWRHQVHEARGLSGAERGVRQ